MIKDETILLADADVLIDYMYGDFSILKLVSEHTAPLYVLRQVIETVGGLSQARCRRRGIEVLEAEITLLLKAGQQSGPLSFEDWLCYLICRQKQWICVTNDAALIQACQAGGVTCRRGLRLMIDLVADRHLSRTKALRVAHAIHRNNPHHINMLVLQEFKKALDEL